MEVPASNREAIQLYESQIFENTDDFLVLLFLTNLHLTTHNHDVGHSNTNTIPAYAVFWLGRAGPAHKVSSESTMKCPKALDIHLKLADVSAANPY